MKMFEDHNGRSWTVTVNVPDVERVKAGCGVDLYDLSREGPIFTLGENYAVALNVLWLLLQPQIEKRGDIGSEEDFYNSLNGDDIEAGATAIVDAMEEWLPLKKRVAFGRAIKFSREMRDKALEQFSEMMGNPDLSRKVDEQLKKQLEGAFTKLQEITSGDFSSSARESRG